MEPPARSTARFAIERPRPDLLLSREAAESIHVAMPVLGCVLPAVQHAAEKGLGERDYIALVLERTNGHAAQEMAVAKN